MTRPSSASSSLDLDTPGPSPLAPPAAEGSVPAPPLAAPQAGTVASPSNPLDLGLPPAVVSAPAPAPAAAPAATSRAAHRPRRVRGHEDVLLTPAAPTVTLTRLQSGAGALRVRLVASEAVGDLRLGCAYQLDDSTSLVQRVPGPQTAPPDGRRPVIRASRDAADGGELLTVDLLQVRRLRRLAVYAFSPSGQALRWGGTLLVELLGGARLQVPLDREPSTGVLVPLTVYAVDGELVLRREDVLVDGSVRAATLAFGYDRITWVDDHTPLVR